MKKIEEYVTSIPDFPEPGIIFRDIKKRNDVFFRHLTYGNDSISIYTSVFKLIVIDFTIYCFIKLRISEEYEIMNSNNRRYALFMDSFWKFISKSVIDVRFIFL